MEENKREYQDAQAENAAENQEETVKTEKSAAQPPKKNWKKEAREWIMAIAVALMVVFFIRGFMFQIIRVDGKSMYDTLDDNERLFVTVYDVRFSTVDRGDIVICHYPNRGNTNLVKRVVAFEGEWVNIDEDGNVYVNGTLLDEPYVDEKAFGECDIQLPYQVPEGRIFVIGDHRATSVDSRSTTVGCVFEEQIVGKIVYRVWPFADFGPVK